MTSADAAVAKHAFKQVRISASVCALAFGGTAAASALSYVSNFNTEASRNQLAATTSRDTGLAVLFGPVSGIDTVGGFTVYKGYVFLTTIGALWALLAATRLLRGEEDSGRWQLVLAGCTRPARATLATIAALAGAVGVLFIGTTLLLLLAGLDPDVGFGFGESVLYGLSIAMPAAVFAAVGALTSQLCRTRRAATGLAIAVFAVAFVLRMIADAGAGTHWLRWSTPLGWSELVQPFTRNDAWPLLPAVAVIAALCVATVAVAARRDVGDGILAAPDAAPPRAFGLRSAPRLALRLDLPVLSAWCAGIAACGVAFGIVAKMTTASVPDSLSDALDKFGVQGAIATQYFGVVFLLVAAVVALLPAGQIGAASEEETSGRLALVLTSQTHRGTWFVGRLALAAAGVVVAALLAGLGAWVGAVSQGVDLELATMIGAGLNVVPTALVALGIGAIVLSVAPRAAAATVYAVVIASLLVDLVGSMVSGAAWLENLSLFHYMALAPAEDPGPATLGITLATALALCSIATMLFERRDVQAA